MLKSYLKIAFRNLVRHKGYSAINIAGLAIGMAVCVLIMLWVQDELSYDSFHTNGDQICRALYGDEAGGGPRLVYALAPGYARRLKEEFPEIVQSTRFRTLKEIAVSRGSTEFYEDRFGFADASFLEMFTFPLVEGDAASSLADQGSLLLSEDMVKKYFGTDDPIGQILKVGSDQEFVVSGIFENVPGNSHLQFDFLVPFVNIEKHMIWDDFADGYGLHRFRIYVQLQNNTDLAALNAKFEPFLRDVMKFNIPTRIVLQKIEDIHLYSGSIQDVAPRGNITMVYVISSVAVLILLLACVNFINLSTARATERAKEVGMRKVVGAGRTTLMRQFFGESLLVTLIALGLAILIIEIVLPVFDELVGKQISLFDLDSQWVVPVMVGMALVVSLLAGGYPAVYLSSFRPVSVLKGGREGTRGKSVLRRTLVIFQYSVSLTLLISVSIVFSQYQYMRNTDLGFDQEQVLYIKLDGQLRPRYGVLKSQLQGLSGVKNVTATARISPFFGTYTLAGLNWVGREDGRPIDWAAFGGADVDFVETMKMELVEGPGFTKGTALGDTTEVIINESTAKLIGIEPIIGLKLPVFQELTVVGVIKDFHNSSLHREIRPAVFHISEDVWNYACVRIEPENMASTISQIEKISKHIEPNCPFEYGFLDESFDNAYRAEERLSRILSYFTSLALLVACLGLFGLAAFSAERRTKEIGIRKVLGASVAGIVHLLSGELVALVAISNIIAWPIAYYMMNRWLENFAYRIDLSVWIFVLAGLAAMLIALLTVSYQAIKAARANPVEALKCE